jgi:transcriptional regulator with GAF, ATPase, and Fis domain
MTKDNEGKLTPRVNREMETEIKEIKVAEELSISQTVIKQVCQTKKPLLISSTKANPYLKNQKSILLYGIQSILVTPILAHDQTLLGVLYLDTRTKTHCFSEKDLELMTGFANQVAIALENELLKEREKEAVAKSAELAAKARYAEQIKKLEEENKLLQARLPRSQFEGIIGQHESIQRVFSAIEQAAATDVTVLITGETGTGKELVARAIHQRSKRSRGPFVVINCTTIPEQLLESELFGYEKGAFTQAYILKEGKFELAEGGTVFLDEIAELPFSVQSKLLRVIELHEIERIGGKGPIKVDIRLVAATNKNLEQLVQQGKFREDLYYRLNVVQISLPPLRERGEDIYLLANYFLTKFNSELQREIKGFSPEAWQALSSYEWPGNVRELWNRIKSAMVMTKNLYLSPEDLGFVKPSQKLPSLKEAKENLEAELVKKALFRYQGNVSRAARELKISRGRLRALITKYHIKYEPGFSEKLEK